MGSTTYKYSEILNQMGFTKFDKQGLVQYAKRNTNDKFIYKCICYSIYLCIYNVFYKHIYICINV